MSGGMDVVDEAAVLIEAERAEGVARAQRALAGAGGAHCATCGDEIAARRRAALPSAVRCARCQEEVEKEATPRPRASGRFEVEW